MSASNLYVEDGAVIKGSVYVIADEKERNEK